MTKSKHSALRLEWLCVIAGTVSGFSTVSVGSDPSPQRQGNSQTSAFLTVLLT